MTKISGVTTAMAYTGGHLDAAGVPDSPMSTGIGAGMMGPSLVPLLNVVPPGQDHGNTQHNNDPPKHIMSHSGPGGVAGFRKREESVGSTKAGSTTSKKRAGLFLSSAKNLFTHANGSERQSVSGSSGERVSEYVLPSDDSHDLQLHMALSAGDVCK